MSFSNLKEFIEELKSEKELLIIEEPVDPVLEVTEIAHRALLMNKPALLFTKPIGSKYPLLMNTYASDRRIELALQKDPDELGYELLKFVEILVPPKFNEVLKRKEMLKRVLSTFPKSGGRYSQAQEIPVRLSDLPVLKCWPQDGGRFITLPQVFTYDPRTGKRNVGMYRMQVFDDATTGMHWQIQKGGGFHYYQAEKLGRDLPVAVALGTDPAMLFATIAALPENIDEVMFAGFLRGKRTPMINAKSIKIKVPVNAEFVLEGIVPANFRRMEGPFGDHFGHYSAAAEFPIFQIRKITTAKDPIYPATIVGIPPMEDKFLGDATQKILGPLIKLIHPEIESLWAYYEAGFHNLLVVSVDERYHKEAVKTALSIMGEGQLSLTKCVILVDRGINPRDFRAVLREIKRNFDPHYDFVMIPKVPLDTLDFTSFKMNLGSKMVIDATSKIENKELKTTKGLEFEQIKKILLKTNPTIRDINTYEDTLLVFQVEKNGRETIEKLVAQKELSSFKIIAAVSEDVDVFNQEKTIWGIFTRFDAERDIVFTEQKLIGISPIYEGILGIDATWKQGYPEPLRMEENIIKKVDEKWLKLFKV
ncbi:MAG: menaquinone biosynthesis decarboxylase [Ignavibacteria bacterium]|jgi:4-hydroxy-3-polyprenylbenzoate decarboxylase|nr:menaquinone biosynthesis decarboxylase [Ignavibacteria bacterium]MDH7528101.1 menaquinone biosynthesis decarboxylase [Ignavibacteria bacterium]